MKKTVISGCVAVLSVLVYSQIARAYKSAAAGDGYTVSQSDVYSDKKFFDIYTECGLGAMLAPNGPTYAAITNITWDSGITAISSHFSSPGNCFGGEGKIASLINKAYALLEADLASGSGRYLDTLAALAARDLRARQRFKAVLRRDFAKAVAAPGYSDSTRFEKERLLFRLVSKHSCLERPEPG